MSHAKNVAGNGARNARGMLPFGMHVILLMFVDCVGSEEVMWTAQPTTPKEIVDRKRGRMQFYGILGRGVWWCDLCRFCLGFGGWPESKKAKMANIKCFKCGKQGHYSDKCKAS